MLDSITRKRIDDCRDVLVGKVPDPKSQIEQITIALIYKFMDDMDKDAIEKFNGKPKFFTSEYAKYGWRKLFDPALSGADMLALYSEALEQLITNPNMPELFRNIFKNAYLPYRDPATQKMFLKCINEFEYSHSEKLGDAFEYLLSVMGSQGDAGQFRTPRNIIDFVTACVNPKKNETVLDPACGTAGFLLSAYKHILSQNTDKRPGDKLTLDQRKKLGTNLVGYDISPDMVRLSLANMYLHGFATPLVHEYDSLSSEERWNETYDVILANPPFMTPKGGIRPHKKFGVQANKAEVLFTDYIAEHLNTNGRAGIIVPNGIVATTQTAYVQLRKMLVQDSLIAVVSLPAGCFNPYSGVKTSVLLLDKQLAKKSKHILFLKVENDGFDLGAQRREHDKNDLPMALACFNAYKDATNNGRTLEADKYNSIALLVEKEKVLANKDAVLSGERYADGSLSTTDYEIKPLSEFVVFTQIGLVRNKADQNEKYRYPYLKMDSITYDGGLNLDKRTNVEATSEEFQKYSLANGDFLYNTRNTPDLVGKSTVFSGDSHKYLFNNNIMRVRFDERLNPYFVNHVLNTPQYKQELKKFVDGTTSVAALYPKNYFSIEIPIPPIEIQRQIVAEIEGYQKIIDGAKQVVNNYKPTINIRDEWEMLAIGEVCEINPKKSELKNIIGDTLVSFLPMSDLNEDNVDFISKEKKRLEEVLGGYTYFRDCDVLFAKVTPCFENGKAGIAKNLENGIGFGSSEYYVLRCTQRVLPMWIYLQIKSAKFAVEGKSQMSGTSGLQRIPKDFVAGYKIPLPPIEEQLEIISGIENEMELVASNQKLTEIFEQKIKNKINEVWGVKEEVKGTERTRATEEAPVIEIVKNKKGKVIELKPTNVDYYKRTLLAAEIVWQLHKELTLGHLKLQKIIYLCQKSVDMQLPANFLKQAMGPYDPKLMRSIDKQLKDKKWFEYHKDGMLKYQPMGDVGKHHVDFEKYFSAEQSGIQFIINKFRTSKSDVVEIVATLYACLSDILSGNTIYSEALLIKRFFEWSKEKEKFTEDQVRQAFKRMLDTGIVPKGFNY